MNSSNTEQSGGLITTTATSTTTVFALDEEEGLPTGTTTTEPVVEPEEVGDGAAINGNAVTVGFDIEADGGGAYVGFETTLLATDEVSSLNLTAFSIA